MSGIYCFECKKTKPSNEFYENHINYNNKRCKVCNKIFMKGSKQDKKKCTKTVQVDIYDDIFWSCIKCGEMKEEKDFDVGNRKCRKCSRYRKRNGNLQMIQGKSK